MLSDGEADSCHNCYPPSLDRQGPVGPDRFVIVATESEELQAHAAVWTWPWI